MPNRGVFISYRREEGSLLARVITDFLRHREFDPFLDVDALTSGQFEEQIREEIGRRDHFVLICTKGVFARCSTDEDCVRREIAHAIKTKRNIVPVVADGFTWSDWPALPEDIAEVCSHNDFEYSHRHWTETQAKLLEHLSPRPRHAMNRVAETPAASDLASPITGVPVRELVGLRSELRSAADAIRLGQEVRLRVWPPVHDRLLRDPTGQWVPEHVVRVFVLIASYQEIWDSHFVGRARRVRDWREANWDDGLVTRAELTLLHGSRIGEGGPG